MWLILKASISLSNKIYNDLIVIEQLIIWNILPISILERETLNIGNTPLMKKRLKMMRIIHTLFKRLSLFFYCWKRSSYNEDKKWCIDFLNAKEFQWNEQFLNTKSCNYNIWYDCVDMQMFWLTTLCSLIVFVMIEKLDILYNEIFHVYQISNKCISSGAILKYLCICFI